MRQISCFLWLLISAAVCAQSSYKVGLIPRINLNQKMEKGWKLNYKVESRFTGIEGEFNKSTTFTPSYTLTDIAMLASKKTGLNNSFAGGFLVRFRDGGIDQRFIQQFTLVKRYNSFRLSHRFVSDQTVKESAANIFRFRYRLSSEIPLNGHAVDANEFYLKVNHEYLHAFESSQYDLEIRLVPLIGYVFKDTNKIEWGIDYRINNFIHRNTSNSFWLTFNWFISI